MEWQTRTTQRISWQTNKLKEWNDKPEQHREYHDKLTN